MLRLGLVLNLLFAAGCDAGLPGPTAPASDVPENLVLILVDTLRADHVGAYGYQRETTPALDALARESVRFERAYATAPWTKPSVASMFTGLYPSSHSVQKTDHSLPESSDTLAEMLSRAGYATGGVVSHKLISRMFNFAQGFDSFVQDDAKGHEHVSSEGVTRSATLMLDSLAMDGRPFFLFVHYFDPHFDYERHPEIGFAAEQAGRIVPGEDMAKLRRLDPKPTSEEVQFLVDLYDEEIRFTDRSIGHLLEALRERGLYEDALIVFTADHGEEFFERGWLGHSRTLYEELIRVPLLVRLPGGRSGGRVVGEPVSLVGLPATVIDGLGFDSTELDLQRGSWLALIDEEANTDPPPAVFSEVDYGRNRQPEMLLTRRSAFMRCIIRGRYKLIHDRYTDRFELYDVASDPLEKHDLSGSEPALLSRLKSELAELAAAATRENASPSESRPLGEAEQEMLRQLGYIDE